MYQANRLFTNTTYDGMDEFGLTSVSLNFPYITAPLKKSPQTPKSEHRGYNEHRKFH